MKKTKKLLSVLLAVMIFAGTLGVLPAGAFENVIDFTDVPRDAWYFDSLATMTYMGVFNGMGDGTFRPNDNITRAQFIKMIGSCSENLYLTDWRTNMHWCQPYWTAMNEANVLETISSYEQNGEMVQVASPIIPMNYVVLDEPITRYEMAFIISNMLNMVEYEKLMALKNSGDSFANHIADYNTMDKSYQAVVEQAYSKGILTGYEDTSFQGDRYLTRAEAVTVAQRYMFAKERVAQSYAVEQERELVSTPSYYTYNSQEYASFAFAYRTMDNATRRGILFGNPNKTYFANSTEAQPYMVSIKIPIWKLNEATGEKYSATAWITVNRVVEKEIIAIFNDIFNDPERFPIKQIGGARYSDTLRHSWGCAIDINPSENYYINYKTGQTVGSFCWKNGSSPYCITPNSSVVRAFAKYGWGWGGQGWSTAADYMHFSILASGG